MELDMISFGITPNNFTPVRRRESTVNIGRFQGDQKQEWTAARCHRLLRALTSRVAILSKEISRYSSLPQPCEEPKSGPISRSKNTAEDGGWTRAKKIRRTYSSRGKRRGNGNAPNESLIPEGRKSLVPGEVSIPTPILARARWEDAGQQSFLISPPEKPDLQGNKRKRGPWTTYRTNDDGPKFRLSKGLQEIRQNMTTSRYTTYEGIYNGLEVLLRSTSKDDPEKKRRGARSLLSMSLRTIPEYISQQEKLLAAYFEETGGKSAISSRDISTEIYDELEAFGSSGKSWKELRTIVRSHGVQVVSGAIRAGLLDVEFCGSLITLCVSTSAQEEAEILLSSLLYSAHFTAPKTLYDTANRRLAILWKYTEYTGRVGFQYRQLSGLILDGLLPVSWLATKDFGQFWTTLIQLSSPDSIDHDAFNFLNTALASLAMAGTLADSGRKAPATVDSMPGDAVKNTFSSLLTTLLAIFILSRETRIQIQSGALKSPNYEYILILLRGCLADFRPPKQSSNSQLTLLLMANMALDSELNGERRAKLKFFDLLLGQLSQQNVDLLDISTTYRDIVTFISNIARCCGRGASTSGFDYLQELHLLLETLACDQEGNDVFKGVIIDSAYLFSEKLPNQQHVDYAACLDTRFGARVMASHKRTVSEGSDQTRSGFRWEEGIGEWVTATPILNNVKRKRMTDISTMDDENTECNTPFRPPQHLRRRPEKEVSRPASTTPVLPSLDDPLSPLSDQLEDLSNEVASSEQAVVYESDDGLAAESSGRDESSSSEESMSEAKESFASSRSSITIEDADLKMRRPAVRRAPRLSRNLLRKSQDWQLFDDLFHSPGSTSSNESNQSRSARQYVDRAPRLGRRALQSSNAWLIFDESDDELSFVSVSSQTSQVMQDTANTKDSKARRVSQKRPSLRPKKAAVALALSDSEDELCN